MVAEKIINFASQQVVYGRKQRRVNYRIKKAYAREPQPVSGHTIKETKKKNYSLKLYSLSQVAPLLSGVLMEA